MVSERYCASADMDEDLSDSDSEEEEEPDSGDEDSGNEDDDASNTKEAVSGFDVVFGSFGRDLDPGMIPIESIEPEIDESFIKIGEISCVIVDPNTSDLPSESEVCEAVEESKEFTQCVISTFANYNLDLESGIDSSAIVIADLISEVIEKTKEKKVDLAHEPMNLAPDSTAFDSRRADLGIASFVNLFCEHLTVFDPGGILLNFRKPAATSVAFRSAIYNSTATALAPPPPCSEFVFDPGGTAMSSSRRTLSPHDGQNRQLLCLHLQDSSQHRSPPVQVVDFRKSAIIDFISAFVVRTFEEAITNSTFVAKDPLNFPWFVLEKLVSTTTPSPAMAPPLGPASTFPWVPWSAGMQRQLGIACVLLPFGPEPVFIVLCLGYWMFVGP